jgi:hypothetical protein
MPQSDLALTEWPFIKKHAFRFFFIFFILYIVLTPNDIFRYSYVLHNIFKQPFTGLVIWFGESIFHVAISGPGNATLDTTFGYPSILFIFLLALTGSTVWAVGDRKASNYNKLYDVLVVVLRYYLAVTWIVYGSVKIIQLQFPPFTPAMLLQTYGNSSPRGLAWAFMGYSAGYNYFIGFTEYAIGLLLFFRRTSTLGNVMGLITLANVIAFNYCYDVHIKLLSSVLMVMTLFLLAKDSRRLINFFLFNKTIQPEDTPTFRFKEKSKNTILLTCKYGFILYVVFFDLYGNFARAKQEGIGTQKPPLYGIYNVKTFIRNKDTIKPLTTDTTRWNKLIVSSVPHNASIMLMNDSMRYFVFNPDTVNKKIVMYAEKDTADKYAFDYSLPKPGVLTIRGKWHKDSLEIDFQQYDLNKFPLNHNSFHWIIDHQAGIKR